MKAFGERGFRDYTDRRRDFYGKLAGAWAGAVSDPFDILDTVALAPSELSDIAAISSALAEIYKSFLGALGNVCNDTLREFGIPPSLDPLMRIGAGEIEFPLLSRVDLVRTGGGYKVLEINADAPGLVVETFPVNAAANAYIGGLDPNSLGEARMSHAIEQSIRRGAARMGRRVDAVRVAFSAWDAFTRDREIAWYLMGLPGSGLGSASTYVPFNRIGADQSGVYDGAGERIDIIFRIFSLRAVMAGPLSLPPPSRSNISASLLADLIRDGKLVIVNDPSSALAESKAAQAAIWGLRHNRDLFTRDQQRIIEAIMLPTFLDPPPELDRYVVKPKFGMNGDTIRIVDRKSCRDSATLEQSYLHEDMVYQEYVELPKMNVMTEFGPADLSLVASCFLIDGVPCGVILRAGKGTTNFDWWVVPVTQTAPRQLHENVGSGPASLRRQRYPLRRAPL
jgi:glutathionylspermidine synthase